jgi:hypothetical protein
MHPAVNKPGLFFRRLGDAFAAHAGMLAINSWVMVARYCGEAIRLNNGQRQSC